MKSFIFILLCAIGTLASAEETKRFSINSQAFLVTYYGEASKIDEATFEGVEKAAWADAVQYLYKHYKYLDSEVNLAEDPLQKVVPELIKRLRSRNTTYYRDGVVRVIVEFSYEGFEKNAKDPFASFKQPPDKL